MKCVECGKGTIPRAKQRVVEMSYCWHPVCLWSEECRETHQRTCESFCRSVGRTPEPHPRDLARLAIEGHQDALF